MEGYENEKMGARIKMATEKKEPVCPHWQCNRRGTRVIRDDLVVGRPYLCPRCRNRYTEEEVGLWNTRIKLANGWVAKISNIPQGTANYRIEKIQALFEPGIWFDIDTTGFAEEEWAMFHEWIEEAR